MSVVDSNHFVDYIAKGVRIFAVFFTSENLFIINTLDSGLRRDDDSIRDCLRFAGHRT